MRRPLLRFAVAAAAVMVLVYGRLAIAPSLAQDPEPSRTLTPGKGSDLAMARCALCHDITHVTRARLSRGEWEYNIKNMIERGAPIAPGEIPVILDYLAAYYNRDVAPPPPDPAAAGAGMADGGPEPVQRLLTANACAGCHGVDQKIVGPSFKEVAARYAGDGGASARLAAKIKSGGAGSWGTVPMPPQPALSDAELQQLVDWILSWK